MPSFICTPIDGSFHSQSFVKVPDAYTAVEELDEQALIRSKCKKADPSSIEENDEKHFQISLYKDEMSGGIFYPFECDERCGEDDCFELYGDYYGIFSQTNQHCFRKSSKEVIIQWMRSLMNSKKN